MSGPEQLSAQICFSLVLAFLVVVLLVLCFATLYVPALHGCALACVGWSLKTLAGRGGPVKPSSAMLSFVVAV